MVRQCRRSHFQWWYRWRAWSALHLKMWWHTRHLSEIDSILFHVCCIQCVGALIFSDDTDDEPEVHCTLKDDDIRGICLRSTVFYSMLVACMCEDCFSSDDTDDEPEVHCTPKHDDIRGICLRLTVSYSMFVAFNVSALLFSVMIQMTSLKCIAL